jgi:glycosyltransferase involved in cell wall biosynthesis
VRTLHLPSLPHTTLTERNLTCAYSQKVHKFARMMSAAGFQVILYGPDLVDENVVAAVDEHVVVVTQADRERWGFGDGFDTANQEFQWTASEPYWFEMNQRVTDAMGQRLAHRPGEYVCLIAGWTQQPIAAAVCGANYRNPPAVEWGVGYLGIFTDFCAFESYSHQHTVYQNHDPKIEDGRAFDAVIPNFFDPDDFYVEDERDDYLLFMGRVIERKGVQVAADIAARTGRRLLVAGPGPTEWCSERIVAPEITVTGPVEYVGEVRRADRAELMAKAHAVLVPTLYIEPFGGVAVEAMMSGAPVVATDWGSFAEIVTPEVGRRFRTLRQGVEAVEEVGALDGQEIRRQAVRRYGLTAVGQMFTRWFDSLDTLWGNGWYA